MTTTEQVTNVPMGDMPPSVGFAESDMSQSEKPSAKEALESKMEDIPSMSGKEGGEVGQEAMAIAKVAPSRFKTADAFLAQLCRAKADTFTLTGPPQDQPIFVCSRDDKVNDVLNGLIKRNIGSVPVLLKTHKYFGFLDLMDVVKYVVQHFGATELKKERSFADLLVEEKKFLDCTVGQLMDHPMQLRNPYHPISSGYSAFAVVEALARERGLHRVPIVDHKRQVINLVTQSQVVRYLADQVESLGLIATKTIKECPRLFKEVLAVREDTIAIDAFNLMVEKNVQGIAICNEDGRLRGNLSLRDLKIVGPDLSLFWRLHQTVKNFVLKLRHEFQQRHGRPRQVVYVTPASTFKEVIHALSRHSIHRIYICNNHAEKKPIGVLTLGDILLEIVDS